MTIGRLKRPLEDSKSSQLRPRRRAEFFDSTVAPGLQAAARRLPSWRNTPMRFPVFAVHRTVGAGNSFPIDVVRFKKALTKAGLTVEPDPKSPSDHPGLWRDAHGDAVPRRVVGQFE